MLPVSCRFLLCALLLAGSACRGSDDARAENSTAEAPKAQAKTFKLGKYVKGTPGEIHQTLQGPVDEFTQKTKEAKQRLAECEADLAAARDTVLPRARNSARYHELAASAKQAEAELEEARRSGTVQQRLDAGSRLNRFRSAMEKTERDALARDPELTRQQARLAEERQSVRRCEQSLKKATAWRDQWVYAIECTFRLNAPVEVGDQGVLPAVKVLKPNGRGHEGVLVEYEAPERQSLGADVEGIQTVNVVVRKVRLLLSPHTPGADKSTAGDVLRLGRNYRIESLVTDAEGPVYVAAAHRADVDALMAEVMPLRATTGSVATKPP